MFATGVHALDLVEALKRAQLNDPNWQVNVLQHEAEQLNLGIAQANLLPTIGVSGSVTRKNQSVDQSALPFSTSAADTVQQVAITARQPIFRWDAWEGLKQVKTSVNLSEINFRLQQQQHILELAETYLNVLRQQSLTAVNLQEEQALLQQLNMMKAKFKEGLIANSDVSEARAQYQNAQANRISAQVQLVLAQEQLAQLIGPYQEHLATLRDDIQFQKPYPAELSVWTDLALAQNLSIQQARLQQRYAEDQRRVEQAARYPQIEAVGSYGYSKQNVQNTPAVQGRFDQVGIEMNWNVYTGGRTHQSIQKATVNVKKSEAALDAAIRKAQTEVKKAYLQVETDQSKLSARKAAMESANLVSRASQAQYQEGLKTMVDVLLAQRNAFSAQQDYINAQYDYFIHVLDLKAAVGQLDEQDIQTMNNGLISRPTEK